MELDPNLPLYKKEAPLNPQLEGGSAKLHAILETMGEELTEKEKSPVPDIAGAPFLREIAGGENITEPKTEISLPQEEKLFDDPSIFRQDVVIGDSLKKVLERILVGNN